MKALINVQGGLGKHIAFTALLPKLKEKYEEIYITCPYLDVVRGTKNVKDSFELGQVDLYKELILKEDLEIFMRDPYDNSNFIKKKSHLLEAWSEDLNIEFTQIEDYNPDINIDIISEQIKKDVKELVNSIDKKFILVQLSGGQSPIMFNENNVYTESIKRNYPFPQQLINKLKKKYPDYEIINFSLPNEPSFENTIRVNIPYIHYIELLKHAEFFVSIDSSLQHMGAAANKKGVVIWGETRPEHFGWPLHNNISMPVENTSPYFRPFGPSPFVVEFPETDKIIEELNV